MARVLFQNFNHLKNEKGNWSDSSIALYCSIPYPTPTDEQSNKGAWPEGQCHRHHAGEHPPYLYADTITQAGIHYGAL